MHACRMHLLVHKQQHLYMESAADALCARGEDQQLTGSSLDRSDVDYSAFPEVFPFHTHELYYEGWVWVGSMQYLLQR